MCRAGEGGLVRAGGGRKLGYIELSCDSRERSDPDKGEEFQAEKVART